MGVWRPDGKSLADYEGWKTWSRNRWAWEFLRRDPRFQHGCDNARGLRTDWNDTDSAEQEELAVAFRFGLSRFKHYEEPYESSAARRPLFRRLMSVRAGRSTETRGPMSVRVTHGDLFVKINVRHLRSAQDLKDHLLWYANQLKELHYEVVGKPLGKRGRTQSPLVYIQFLRILDGDHAGRFDHELAKEIFPGKTKATDGIERTDAEWAVVAKSTLRSAREMVKRGWHDLVEVKMEVSHR